MAALTKNAIPKMMNLRDRYQGSSLASEEERKVPPKRESILLFMTWAESHALYRRSVGPFNEDFIAINTPAQSSTFEDRCGNLNSLQRRKEIPIYPPLAGHTEVVGFVKGKLKSAGTERNQLINFGLIRLLFASAQTKRCLTGTMYGLNNK
jgi:hypothetical protein